MIPGFIISIITFPGVIVHEFAHLFFCRLMRAAVFDVCYFRFGNPAGYVVHEPPKTAGQNLMIAIGPFLVNSVVGAIIAMPAAIPVLELNAGSPIDYVLIWLGVSIAMHSFPSTGDARSIWAALKSPGTTILTKAIATPIVAIIYLGAVGSFFWLDLAYGVALALGMPHLLAHLFA
jgi:hypothetical protein